MADLPLDITEGIAGAVAAGEKPGKLFARLQLAERGIGWHSFYHHVRRLRLANHGQAAQRRPGAMQVWAAALAGEIVDRLVAVYPPAFVADIIASARERLIAQARADRGNGGET